MFCRVSGYTGPHAAVLNATGTTPLRTGLTGSYVFAARCCGTTSTPVADVILTSGLEASPIAAPDAYSERFWHAICSSGSWLPTSTLIQRRRSEWISKWIPRTCRVPARDGWLAMRSMGCQFRQKLRKPAGAGIGQCKRAVVDKCPGSTWGWAPGSNRRCPGTRPE